MAEKPILFSTSMVLALLNTKPGVWPAELIDFKPYKWMTRRVIKPQPDTRCQLIVEDGKLKEIWRGDCWVWNEKTIGKPKYNIGDILWVRETFTKTEEGDYIYRSDPMFEMMHKGDIPWSWTSPLFLPRKAARLLLEVKAVRIERLQKITREETRAEGAGIEWLKKWVSDNYVEPDENAYWIGGSNDQSLSFCKKCGKKEVKRLKKENPDGDFWLDGGWDFQENDVPTYCDACSKDLTFTPTNFCVEQEYEVWQDRGFSKRDTFLLSQIIDDDDFCKKYPELERICFRALWDELNAKRGYPWESNPWVYVYEFMRLT
jgi:hypothetical protein